MSARDRWSSWWRDRCALADSRDENVALAKLNDQIAGDLFDTFQKLEHVRAHRDQLLAFYALDVADLDRLAQFNHPSNWFGGTE